MRIYWSQRRDFWSNGPELELISSRFSCEKLTNILQCLELAIDSWIGRLSRQEGALGKLGPWLRIQQQNDRRHRQWFVWYSNTTPDGQAAGDKGNEFSTRPNLGSQHHEPGFSTWKRWRSCIQSGVFGYREANLSKWPSETQSVSETDYSQYQWWFQDGTLKPALHSAWADRLSSSSRTRNLIGKYLTLPFNKWQPN